MTQYHRQEIEQILRKRAQEDRRFRNEVQQAVQQDNKSDLEKALSWLGRTAFGGIIGNIATDIVKGDIDIF